MKKLLLLFAGTAIFYAPALQAQDTITPAQDPALKRYLGMVEMGFLLGSGGFGNGSLEATPAVMVFNGYQFHRAFALGATIGVAAYEASTITPMALGMRGSLGDRRVRPFYALDLGYGTTTLNKDLEQAEHRGGWMINPAAGVLISAGNQTAFSLSLGYSRQRAEHEYTRWNGDNITTNKYSFKRLSLRMGFQF